MVEEHQNSSVANEVAEPAAAAPGRQSAAAQPKRSGGTLALLLSLVALGVAGYAAYQIYLGTARFDAQQQELARVESLIMRSDQRIDQLDRAQRELGAAQTRSATEAEQHLNGLRSEIAARSGTTTQGWILAEAEYLIRLANQRILIEQEVTGAMALLQATDGLLRDAELVSAMDVRRALAGDIERLKGAGSVDSDGIYLRLGALATQVDALPRQQLSFSAPTDVKVEADVGLAAVDGGWRGQLSGVVTSIGNRLATLFDYRTGVDRIEPILPPSEEYYLRQNLKLRLEMTQLALLKKHQRAYDQSLAESIDWVSAHFDPEDPATRAMLSSLAELSEERIAMTLPDISGSLTAMRRYMSGFHKEGARPQVAEEAIAEPAP